MKFDYKSSLFPSHSLRNKLLLTILPVLIIGFIFILAINCVYQLEKGQASAENNLSLLANRWTTDIQSWLVERRNLVGLVANDPVVQHNVMQIVTNGPDANQARQTMAQFLQTMVQQFSMYDEIYGLSPDGRILFSTDQSRVKETRPDDNLVKQPLEQGGVYFQDAYLAYSTRVPSVAYSVAVKAPDGQPLAVLVFRVSINELLDSIGQDQVRLGQTGEIVLLRHDQVVINQLRSEPGSPFSLSFNTVPAQLALKGEQGVAQSIDYDNDPVVAAYGYIPYSGWGLVVKQDLAEIMEPIWRSSILLTLPGLVALVLLILLIVFFISRITAPLQEITRASVALSHSEFGQRIDTKNRRDEIGVLGQSFNDMAAGLEAQFNVRDRLRQMLEVLVSTIRTSPLVNTALETVARSHAMSVGAVYLKAEEADTLMLAATYCPSGKMLLEKELAANEGPGGQALSCRRPVVLEAIPTDTVYTVNTISGELLPTWIAHLPLVFGDKVLGLMVLGSISRPEADCLEQLQAAAALLGVSLNNSLMFDQVESLSEKLSLSNEELSLSNEELRAQTEELQVQAEELYAKGQELVDKNQQLEQATQMKSSFLARMSHELRTPLNSIIGFCEILVEGLFGDLNPKQEEYLKDILSSGHHLLSLINDILDLSKIEAGREELVLRRIDPLESLQEALTLTWPQAERKQLHMEIKFSPGQYYVKADSEKLKQIFLNLLSNAIKFSYGGGHIIADAGTDGRELVISLADQGIGIAPELHRVIFGEFKQGKPGPDSAQQGTGLGLAITKKLVEMHEGRIWVDSRPGFGATFSFTLLLADDNIAPVPLNNHLSSS